MKNEAEAIHLSVPLAGNEDRRTPLTLHGSVVDGQAQLWISGADTSFRTLVGESMYADHVRYVAARGDLQARLTLDSMGIQSKPTLFDRCRGLAGDLIARL